MLFDVIGTLRVRPCISSSEELCVFFGELMLPEASTVSMLIKAQQRNFLSGPFLDLHSGHVEPSVREPDSYFLGKTTLEEISQVAKACGYPFTRDQHKLAKYVLGFGSGFCGLSGPGGCGKSIILASCILARMRHLRGNQRIAYLFPKNDMKFAAVELLRKLLLRLDKDASVFQIAGFGKSKSPNQERRSLLQEMRIRSDRRSLALQGLRLP